MSSVVVPIPERREPKPHRKLISDGVLGMLLFVFIEVMIFAGFISAFLILKSKAGVWPPPGQPRLPFEETAINTTALLVSGLVLFMAERAWRQTPDKPRQMASAKLMIAILLGLFFVGFQGVEWVGLIGEGLTMTSSTHGAFFYLIIGAHGLHAVAALAAMIWAWVKLRSEALSQSAFRTVQIFWYFVVGLWPILYIQVYL